MRRTVLVLAVLLSGAVPFSQTPPAAAEDPPSACIDVLSGAGDGPLDKSFVSQQDNGDGTYTLTYLLQTPRPPGSYRVRDCAWVDLNGNEAVDADETVVGTDQLGVPVGADGEIDLELVITGTEGQSVCDRAALSGAEYSNEFTDKSNVHCIPLEPGTEVPVGSIGGIGLTLLAAVALALATLRARRRTSLPLPNP